jgi:NAD(P)-dependent dehydrogenase (short-subunit alcohol dehydrogenase family)
VKTVLVTGAGRGIGKAIALKLAADGWHVFAGVRKTEDGSALEAATTGKITPIKLDVTSREQIIIATDTLPDQLDALVNNAGIAINEPMESISPEQLQRQFDVNVFGTVSITQAMLPKIRAARGRIVFISSMSGRISTPLTGPYSGSKYALEGIVDALRMEVKPWGIGVSLVEPGAIETDIWANMVDEFDGAVAGMSPQNQQLYEPHTKGMRRVMKVMRKTTVPVDHVVKNVEKALTSKRPKARYVVGVPSRLQLIATAVGPTAVNDFVVSRATGIPRKL